MKIDFKVKRKKNSSPIPSLKIGLFAQSLWLLLSFVLFEFNSDLAFVLNLSTLFAPLPYAVLAMSRGALHATFISVLATISILLMDGATPALTYFFLFSFSGVALAFFLRRDKPDFADFLMDTMEASIYLKLAFFVILFRYFGRNVTLPDTKLLQEALAPFASQLPNFNLAEYLKLLTEFSSKMLPTTLVVFVATEIYICYRILARIAKRQGVKLLKLPPVSCWAFSQSLFYALIFAFGLEITARFASSSLAICGDIAMNVEHIVFALFFVQGFACVLFFLKKHKVCKFLQFILAFFALLIGVPTCLLSFLGAADVLWNFRKL